MYFTVEMVYSISAVYTFRFSSSFTGIGINIGRSFLCVSGVKLEKPVVWIVGSSVVKDVIQFGKAFPEYDIAAMLKDDVSAVFTHGEMDMKIEDLLPAVKYMLKTTERPHMILFQCGEHNVCVGRNADLIDIVKKDLALIKQEIPGVVLVWSQMLPPWMAEDHTGSTLAKSRRRINRFMMQCFLSEEIGGAFLYHSMLRTNLKLRYYMKTSDGFLHLKKKGMKTYIDQLEVGIRYLITGHGSIFPYLKWPLYRDQLTRIEPECMCMLNEEQIQSLDNARLATFSAEQIQGLSTKQILMFRKNQSYFVFCKDFISKLSEKQLEGLTKKHFMHLNNHQISYFQKRDRFMFIRKEVQDFIKKKVKVNTKLSKGRGENPTEYERGEGHVETERENERRQDDTLENLSDTMSESGQSWEDEKEWEEKFGRRGTPENENRYRSYSRECESSYSNSSSEKHRSDSNDRGRRGRKNSFRERYRSRSGSRNRYRSYSRERERSVSRERYRRSCSKERHRRRSHSSERSDSRRNHSSGNIHHVHVPYPPVVPYPGMIPAFRPPPDRLHPFPAMPYPACPPFLPAPRPPFYPVPFPGAYPRGQLPIPWSPASDGAQVGSNSSLEIPSERSSINTSNLTVIK